MPTKQTELKFQLLGKPSIIWGEKTFEGWGPAKLEALVYYLAVVQGPVPRRELANLLWPEARKGLGLRYLSQQLVRLRKHFEPFLAITPETLFLQTSPLVTVDLHQLTKCFPHMKQYPANESYLRQTLDYYRGPFLDGFHVFNSPEFTSWMETTREEVMTQVMEALLVMAQTEADRGALLQAHDDLDRLLSMMPWHEAAHRLKMLLFARQTRYSAAIEQYRICRVRLAEELDVTPDPETEALFARIRQGKIHETCDGVSHEKLDGGEIDDERNIGAINPVEVRADQVEANDIIPHEVVPDDSKQNETHCVAHQTVTSSPKEVSLDDYTSNPHTPNPHTRPHYTPAPLLPLLGRDGLIKTIRRYLQRTEHRLITLVGMGGAGKTHIALMVGQDVQDGLNRDVGLFRDGVCFVSLAGVTPAVERAYHNQQPHTSSCPNSASHPNSASQTIASEMAGVLNLPPGSQDDVQTQVFRYLHKRQILLIFDNFEHVLSAKSFLVLLMQEAPDCVLLVTSRVRLRLPGETVLHVDPLPIPSVASVEDQLVRELNNIDPYVQSPDHLSSTLQSDYACILLFLDRARRHNLTFELHRTDFAQILDICRLTGGLPIALEMVAAWTEHLTLADIATQLRQDRTLLVQDVAAEAVSSVDATGTRRHQTIDALIEHSWRLLQPNQQHHLMMMAHFAGTFDRHAATNIVGLSLPQLKQLTDTSLLQVKTIGRYELHPLVQSFLRDQWHVRYTETSPETTAFWQTYCTYFLTVVVDHAARLDGEGAVDALTQLRREQEHIDLAWRQTLHYHWLPLIEMAFDALTHFYRRSGLYQEVFACCQHLNQLLAGMPASNSLGPLLGAAVGDTKRLRETLQLHSGVIQMETHRHLSHHTEGLAIGKQLQPLITTRTSSTQNPVEDERVRTLEIRYYLSMAYLSMLASELEKIQQHCHQVQLRLSSQSPLHLHGRYEMIMAFYTSFYNSDLEAGLAHGNKALAHYRQIGNRWGEAEMLFEMGALLASYRMGGERMMYYLQESLRIRQQLRHRVGEAETLSELGRMPMGTTCLQRIAYLKAAIEIHEELGHDYRTYYTLVPLASEYIALGQYDQAHQLLTPLLTKDVTLADSNLCYMMMGNLSLVASLQKHPDHAYDLARKMLTFHDQVAQHQHAFGYMVLGYACMGRGALTEAKHAFEQAHRYTQEQRRELLEVAPRTGLAHVAYLQDQDAQRSTNGIKERPRGRFSGILSQQSTSEHLATALAEVEWLYVRLDVDSQYQYVCEHFWPHWACYQVFRAVNDARADELLTRSYAELRQRADEIMDPVLRASFLESVAVNRMIVAEVHRDKS
ncbi:MAG: BTAD domain-containing putative transcriptional regulator [Chloroflexota bacterium]